VNKERRKAIAAAIAVIEEAREKLDMAKEMIDDIKSEEEEYKENMPESMQDGDKGQRADEAIDALGEAYGLIENFDIDEITGQLETAAQ
jgi:threonine dehydrogenase-like Zn-dependent dehydrogenase